MDIQQIFLVSIVALLLWALILGVIIESATKAKKIERQLRIQTMLLAKMAEKQGVTKDEINFITNQK